MRFKNRFESDIRFAGEISLTSSMFQIKRVPKPFPVLNFKRTVKSIEDFVYEDFVIQDYVSHPAIKMDMAI